MPAKRRSELEKDLKCVLSELDDFQLKVDASDNSDQANANLEQDLQKLLRNLDDFQKKIQEADEEDVGALTGMLGELQEKLMLGEEMEANKSTTTKPKKKPRELKGETPEAHLQLYMQRRASKGTQDLPQAILLQNFIERKQQKQSKNWFHDLLFKTEPIESRRAGLFPIERELSKQPEQQSCSKSTLRASNEKLKETIVRLEDTIAQMERSHRSEITAHQEVIQKLQAENMTLHETVFSLKQREQEYEKLYEEISAYEDIISQLQKENIQLHYKVELMAAQEDPLGDPPGYLSSSLEDSYSQSPSLREMTNRVSPAQSKVANSVPFNILRMM